ncbi:group II intron maturase-specific domain-containing protein [Vibrio maritimus]|uniref:group II intron maturase-specific domain-containing protein n=1 Tax=Vibrio maritimus TaxID=990268 RepID=UPI004068FBDF
MRSRVRPWRLSTKTPATLEELSRLDNSIIRGWFQYYGCFYSTQMRKLANYLELRLCRWARQKYKGLAEHKRKSLQWLRYIAQSRPSLFINWHYFEKSTIG